MKRKLIYIALILTTVILLTSCDFEFKFGILSSTTTTVASTTPSISDPSTTATKEVNPTSLPTSTITSATELGPIAAEKVKFNDYLLKNGPLTQDVLPSIGSPKVLVIPVNLDNANATQNALNEINIAFNGTEEETGFESVKSYYYESSYGTLDLQFDVVNEWFTPKYDKNYYDNYSDDTYQYGSDLILREALAHYDSYYNMNDYDYDSNGYIDGVWLIYNCAVDYDGVSNIYWAFVSWDYTDYTYDGIYANSYGFAGIDFMHPTPEEAGSYDPTGIKVDAHTFIHETGHMLGLDDYYDYDENVGPTGGLYCADMMDGNIGDHGMISKLLLGWVTPTVVTGSGTITLDLKSFSSTGEFLLIANHDVHTIYDEYFLIELYANDGLNKRDGQITDPYSIKDALGIRIIHVDASINYDKNGKVTYNSGDYMTGFKYDNSDEAGLFCNMLSPEPFDYYAYQENLYTKFTDVFGIDDYTDYMLHDGTTLFFSLEINSITKENANLSITIK